MRLAFRAFAKLSTSGPRGLEEIEAWKVFACARVQSKRRLAFGWFGIINDALACAHQCLHILRAQACLRLRVLSAESVDT